MSTDSIGSSSTERGASERRSSASDANGGLSTKEPSVFWWTAVAILAIGVFLRFFLLELRPFHHDEGVNGFFLIRLLREKIYHYDPENYHGPTLYFAALVLVYLLGLSSLVTRLLTALFGIATLWLTLGFRKTIGRTGALAAMALLALSPGAVFFSRYFIHEILFACFTLGLVVTILRYCDTRQPQLLLTIGVWTALLFATKETSIITAGALLIAWPCAWIHVWLQRRFLLKAKDVAAAPQAAASERIEPPDLVLWIASALAVFVLISVILYSSFFTYPEGVHGALRTFAIWRKTGETAHVHAWDTYFNWLFRTEASCLVLGAIGVIVALWRCASRKTVFLAYWTIGMLAAYSIVKYKTPWLALNIVLPLAVMGGYAVSQLLAGRTPARWLAGSVAVTASGVIGLLLPPASLHAITFRGLFDLIDRQASRYAEDPRFFTSMAVPLLVMIGALASALLAFVLRRRLWIAAMPALIMAAGVSLYQTIELNFFRYDDDRYVYVYAHTRRGFLELVENIKRLAQVAGSGPATPVSVTSAEHWPLSWYLRDFTQAGYHGAIAGLDTATIVVGHVNQDGELRSRLSANFTRLGVYPLRPGVDLVLFARNDVARRAGLTAR